MVKGLLKGSYDETFAGEDVYSNEFFHLVGNNDLGMVHYTYQGSQVGFFSKLRGTSVPEDF